MQTTASHVTKKALQILSYITKVELASYLKITRVTLDTRLKKHTWKVTEDNLLTIKLKQIKND